MRLYSFASVKTIKCQPKHRQWPDQKCDRCIKRNLTCSEPQRIKDVAPSGRTEQESAVALLEPTTEEAPIVERPSLRAAQGYGSNTITLTLTRHGSSLPLANTLNAGLISGLVCCGLPLATLPDLLHHIEERHKDTPPIGLPPLAQIVPQHSLASPTVGIAATRLPGSADEEEKQRKL